MNNLNLKELKILREALEDIALTIDPEIYKELRDKLDAELHNHGYKWEIRAFEKHWKKIK